MRDSNSVPPGASACVAVPLLPAMASEFVHRGFRGPVDEKTKFRRAGGALRAPVGGGGLHRAPAHWYASRGALNPLIGIHSVSGACVAMVECDCV